MELSRQNFIDAINCEKKNCLECSMLSDKKTLLESCIAIIASSALALLDENLNIKSELFKQINENSEKGEKQGEQS